MHNSTLSHKYDKDGPLCYFKFLPWSPAHQEYASLTSLEDSSKSDCTHVSHIVIGLHHGISDGFSNLRIIRHLLKLIDDHLAGRSIDENDQVCSIIDDSEKDKLLSQAKQAFLDDEKFLQERTEFYKHTFVETLIEKVYPVTAGLPEKTCSLVHIVDKATTQKFKSKCKAEGVTFHAGFCSVLNAAIVRLVSSHCEGKESITIPSFHAKDLRYYYEKNKEAFGCGIASFGTIFEAPLNIMDDFWNSAKSYNDDLRYAIKSKACLEQGVIQNLTGITLAPKLNDHTSGSPLPSLIYYLTTNMLDVTPIVGNVGDNVHLQFYEGLNSIHKLPLLWMSTYQTFRDQLIHSVQYNNQFMGDEAAKQLSATIFEVLAEVI